jgi:pimeloyl-ACP methyl ester carboxylesterase
VFCTRFRATMDHWDPALLDLLAAEREIIVFDNVGTGASTGTTPATIQGLADGAVQFIQVHRGAWAAARVRVGSPASRPSRSR